MASADYTSRGAVAVITLDNQPVNALGLSVRRGRRRRPGARRGRRLGGCRGAHRRGGDVLRRRGRERIRLARHARLAASHRSLRTGGELPEARDRRVERSRPRRRPGTRHVLSLPRGARDGASRIARGETRDPAGRRRHPAPAAPRRSRARLEHDRQRHAGDGARAREHGALRRGRRVGCGVGGDCLRTARRRGEAAAEESARHQNPVPQRRGLLRFCARGRRAARQELSGTRQMHRCGRSGGVEALRRRDEGRAHRLHRIAEQHRIEGAAARVLRHPRGLQDSRMFRPERRRGRSNRWRSSAPAPWAAASP